jgi:hypothetical protein
MDEVAPYTRPVFSGSLQNSGLTAMHFFKLRTGSELRNVIDRMIFPVEVCAIPG